MNLQLSLKREWFEMTKSGEKKEDYREITPYWFKRFFNVDDPDGLPVNWDMVISDVIYDIQENGFEVGIVLKSYRVNQKPFTTNTMTLGYPSKTDTDRIIKFEHSRIEIRTGNPEWGAEPNKLYFVIKHGKRLN